MEFFVGCVLSAGAVLFAVVVRAVHPWDQVRQWRSAVDAHRAGEVQAAARLTLNVDSTVLVRSLLRLDGVMLEMQALVKAKVCSHAVLVEMLRAGERPSTMQAMWDGVGVGRWLLLRVWDRRVAAAAMESSKSSPLEWQRQRFPAALLVVAWVGRLSFEEKRFLASFVYREDLKVLSRLPGGIRAWLVEIAGCDNSRQWLSWAMRDPSLERIVQRHGEHIVGIPRMLARSTGGGEALARWMRCAVRQELVVGVARGFPGTAAELRAVLGEM